MKEKYVLIVLFTVLTIVFFSGKGGFLIAGYNAMSDNKKQRYNYRRLCYVMGGGMLLIDVLLIISCVIGEAATDRFENVFLILGIVVTFLIVLLANIICRKK